MVSHRVADAEDPVVLAQLRRKFPPKQHQLPATVPKVAAINAFEGFNEVLLTARPGMWRVLARVHDCHRGKNRATGDSLDGAVWTSLH